MVVMMLICSTAPYPHRCPTVDRRQALAATATPLRLAATRGPPAFRGVRARGSSVRIRRAEAGSCANWHASPGCSPGWRRARASGGGYDAGLRPAGPERGGKPLSTRRSWQRRVVAVALPLAVAWGWLFGTGVATADDALPELPPLVDPATHAGLTGKIVWADLFVDDVERAREFYTGLFGWGWRWVTEDRATYGLLLRDGVPVAGIAYLDPDRSPAPYARWVHYVSTTDVPEVAVATTAGGGRVLLTPRSYPERGEFSVLADPEGAIFGTMDSIAGDPGDYRARDGEWLWHVLYSRNMNSAARFYGDRFGYELFEYAWREDQPRLVLASQGYARASISPMPANREDAHAAWVGFVMTADVPATVARARSLGAEVLFPPSPEDHDNGIAIIADPLGGIVGLLSWVFDDGERQP
jgi:predicted enzyme related to lactoylglutathione lyase